MFATIELLQVYGLYGVGDIIFQAGDGCPETDEESLIMGADNLVFLENLEWFDESGKAIVHRLLGKGSGEIKFGAQLTVREGHGGDPGNFYHGSG